MIKLMFFIDLV